WGGGCGARPRRRWRPVRHAGRRAGVVPPGPRRGPRATRRRVTPLGLSRSWTAREAPGTSGHRARSLGREAQVALRVPPITAPRRAVRTPPPTPPPRTDVRSEPTSSAPPPAPRPRSCSSCARPRPPAAPASVLPVAPMPEPWPRLPARLPPNAPATSWITIGSQVSMPQPLPLGGPEREAGAAYSSPRAPARRRANHLCGDGVEEEAGRLAVDPTRNVRGRCET